ncbi:MAG: PLP-dependent aminotransferase family protein [Tissierellia bacterium]|nr:PLP-dependent aminotransferase family protein [Tissierellia bacterium]
MLINKDINTPLYIQLYENIRNLIDSGQLEEGEKLPSIRSLADKLQVNNITVVNAYKLLEQEKYVYSIRGSGTYVKSHNYGLEAPFMEDGDIELMIGGILPISKDSINFASVSPTPDIFPIEEFKQSLVEVLDRDRGSAFMYPEINGYKPLRESISLFMHENYGMDVDEDEIQIISGGQQGIDIITKTLITQGDWVLVENPTYSAAIAAFKSRGARTVGIPILKDGIDLKILKEQIEKYNPKLLYIMTNYQNPTTYSYSKEKGAELLELSKQYDFYIIEDDFMMDLNYDARKITLLKSMDQHNQVIYIKSFSKIFMPGVRIAFMTVPANLFEDIIRVKHTTDISSSGFLQRAFDLYLRKGYWKNHITNIKNEYTKKYNTMIQQLNRLKRYGVSFEEPRGGLSIWLKLPKDMDSMDLYTECAEKNIAIVPGKIFFTDDSIYSNYVRMSFSAVSEDEIIHGIGIIDNYFQKIYMEDSNKYIPFL